MNSTDLKELHTIIYKASTARMPNFGGHHGVHGMSMGLAQDLQASVVTLAKATSDKTLNKQMVEQFRAQCSLANATGIFAEDDLRKIDTILDKAGV